MKCYVDLIPIFDTSISLPLLLNGASKGRHCLPSLPVYLHRYWSDTLLGTEDTGMGKISACEGNDEPVGLG